MKHLKSFNESLDNDAKRDIEDICLDLTDFDKGFEVVVDPIGNNFNSYCPSISIHKIPPYMVYPQFKWIEIKETVLRLFDYLKINNISIKKWVIHTSGGNDGYLNLPLENIGDNHLITSIWIVIHNDAENKIMGYNESKLHFVPNEECSKRDILEMCYDLRDTGFEISLESSPPNLIIGKVKSNDMDRNKDCDMFLIDDEIKEVLLRVIDYLGDKFNYLAIKIINEYPNPPKPGFAPIKRWEWKEIFREYEGIESIDKWRTSINIPQDIMVKFINVVVREEEELNEDINTFNESTHVYRLPNGETWESFPSDIVEDIQDICLELQDDGFEINTKPLTYPTVTFGSSGPQYFITISKCIVYDFKYDDVSDVIERIKDFVSQNGYNVRVDYTPEIVSNVNLSYINIFFTKNT